MKIQPEEVKKIRTSNGKEVSTVDEWKQEELIAIGWVGIDPDENQFGVASELVRNAERVIAVLAYKERGRPVGAKNRKPRKAKTAPAE